MARHFVKSYEDIVKKIIEVETAMLGSTSKVNPHLRQILAAQREMLIWCITKEEQVWKKALAKMYRSPEYAKLKSSDDAEPAGQETKPE